MKTKLLLVFTFILLNGFLSDLQAQNPTFEWVKHFKGNSFVWSRDIVVDSHKNTYICGHFTDTVDFDPGVNIEQRISMGDFDAFLLKLDSNGNFLWVNHLSSTSTDYGESLILSAIGEVYFSGFFSDSATLIADTSRYSYISNGSGDAFIMKLNSNGGLLWFNQMGGSILDAVSDLELDDQNNLYATGNYGDTVDFDPGLGQTFLYAPLNSSNIFISKYNGNGHLIWAKGFGGNSNDHGRSIKVASNGAVYLVGDFRDTVDFVLSTGIHQLRTQYASNTFILKLTSSGSFEWVKQLVGPGTSFVSTYNFGNFLEIDALTNIYIAGDFGGNAFDINPDSSQTQLFYPNGPRDFYLAKLDSAGNLKWANQYGGNSLDRIYDLKIDNQANIYMCGYFSNSIDMDASASTYLLNSNGGSDIFNAKIDSSSQLIWAHNIGGVSAERGFALEVSQDGHFYSAGGFSSTTDFDPDSAVQQLTPNSLFDGYLLKMSTVTVVGVSENSNVNLNLKIYPNPSSDFIQIEMDAQIDKILIYDIKGTLLMTENQPNFSVNKLPSGNYFATIFHNKGISSFQFIKQ